MTVKRNMPILGIEIHFDGTKGMTYVIINILYLFLLRYIDRLFSFIYKPFSCHG